MAHMAEERKVWLEAHGAMEGAQGGMTIRAELLNQNDLASARQSIAKENHMNHNSSSSGNGNDNGNHPEEDESSNKAVVRSSKIVHFQRHGQGYHNLIFRILDANNLPVTDIYEPDPARNPFVKPEIRDSPLTELGRNQCSEQRRQVVQQYQLQPQLVIASPLHRALLTAQMTFQDAMDQGVDFVAHSACREELGILTCNWRRPLSDTLREYPHFDFGLLLADEEEEDSLWSPTEKEAAIHQSQRIYDFLVDYVRVQPQEEIAVVGHSAWLFTMCNAVIDCGGDEQLASWFETSEIRSMKLTWEPIEGATDGVE